uniref:Nucleolar protein 14 n=1 Tax=Schistosoma haematobium TaxID=6185 RepID=A0A095C5F3_SCHHA
MKKNPAKKQNRTYMKKPARRITISRSKSLKSDLERYEKVGGVFDKRLGNRNVTLTESEKSLQRHIVEKLRQLDSVSLESVDDKDPLFKAAFDSSFPARKLCTADDVEGGIEGHIVENIFFTNGSTGNKLGHSFKDSLEEKIAATKLEKLRRVEENEEQRERLKVVNDEWTKNIRFLLNRIHSIKKVSYVINKRHFQRPTTATQQNNNTNVSRLLETLSTDKKVVPIGSSNTHNSQEQLFRLQDMVSHLRILLRLPKEKSTAIIFISHQLWTARLHRLKDVVRYLFLIQLAFEYCSEIFERLENDGKLSTKIIECGIFCPEIVHALSRLFRLTSLGSNLQKHILVLRKPLTTIEVSDLPSLDIRLVNRSSPLSLNEIPVLRLTCVYKMIRLANQVFLLYNKFLPKCVLVNLFRPLKTSLVESNFLYHPTFIVNEIKSLFESIKSAENAPTPARLISDRRLLVLNTLKPTDSKEFKKLGILPQLEPVFDERLCVNQRDNTKRTLQRKIAKEKRCAMRAIRQDCQFLASHQLNIIKKRLNIP